MLELIFFLCLIKNVNWLYYVPQCLACYNSNILGTFLADIVQCSRFCKIFYSIYMYNTLTNYSSSFWLLLLQRNKLLENYNKCVHLFRQTLCKWWLCLNTYCQYNHFYLWSKKSINRYPMTDPNIWMTFDSVMWN